MITYRYGQTPPPVPGLPGKQGAVVAVGNFDGMHLGHQAVIRQALSLAQQRKLPLLVVTFHPHPSEVVRNMPFPLLSEPLEREAVLLALGVNQVVCIDFTRELSLLSAEQFCRELLCDWLQMRLLCVGHDFRLGYKRQGDEAELNRIGKLLGFESRFFDATLVGGERVSSSMIRDALLAGQVEKVPAWLGRPYALGGLVVQGDQRGRTLGFPTANLAVAPRRLLPANGVYACMVQYGGKRLRAVANIGTRPTIGVDALPQLEVHLLDFHAEIYGQRLEVQFIQRLREEKRFANLAELKAAIGADIAKASKILPSLSS